MDTVIATPKSNDSSAVQLWKAASGITLYELATPNHFISLQLANGALAFVRLATTVLPLFLAEALERSIPTISSLIPTMQSV